MNTLILNVGEKVIRKYNGGLSVTEVERETKTLYVMKNGDRLRKGHSSISNGNWNTIFYEKYDKEKIDKRNKSQAIAIINTLNKYRNTPLWKYIVEAINEVEGE